MLDDKELTTGGQGHVTKTYPLSECYLSTALVYRLGFDKMKVSDSIIALHGGEQELYL